MLAKTIILFAVAFIIYNLGRGMFFLVQDQGQTTRTVKSLSWRIGLSLALFGFLFAAYGLGWIHPHGIV
jgi:low temperature requirement protein LtrA